MIYDNIIIGAGISGLYTSYKIKKKYPNETLLILESNNKIGGRMGVVKFHDVNILIGAGVGRFDKDIRLKKLLNELNISYKKFTIDIGFSSVFKNHIDIMETIKNLKKEYKKDKQNTTFKLFALSKINKKEYKNFIQSVGLTDYEKEDIYETLYNYGMEDNTSGWTGMSIDWNILLDKLAQNINIKLNSYVKKIIKDDDLINIKINKDIEYNCKKLYIATDIKTVQHILKDYPIYKQIHGQPFIRVYAKFSNESLEIMKKYVNKTTFVNTDLYKIIPINNGIYMIAYSDNRGANNIKKIIDKDKKYKNLTNLVKKSLDINENLKIDDIITFYWKIGTHYYEPLNDEQFKTRKKFIKKAQKPEKNIFIVGESISTNQGWTEGALESVDNIFY
jgi:hypothetical protein